MHVIAKSKTEEDLEKALNTIEEKENKVNKKENDKVITGGNHNSENVRKLSTDIKINESVMQANKIK